jgi:hypothetical protein
MRIPWNPAPISDTVVQKAQVQRLPRCRLNKSRLSRGKLPWHMANEAGAYIQRLGSDCDAPLRIVRPPPDSPDYILCRAARRNSSEVLLRFRLLQPVSSCTREDGNEDGARGCRPLAGVC